METEQIKRDVFVRLLGALALVSEKGNLEFDRWLGLEKFRVELEEIKEKEAKIFQRMMDNIGYTDYAKKAKKLFLKNQKTYTHTDAEVKIIEQYDEKLKEFSESLITIPYFRIPKALIAELPEEALSARKDLMPIIEMEEKSEEVVKKTKKN